LAALLFEVLTERLVDGGLWRRDRILKKHGEGD
jgi:hypothetical protein